PVRAVGRLVVVAAELPAHAPAPDRKAVVAPRGDRQRVDEVVDHPQDEGGDHREVDRLGEQADIAARVRVLVDRRGSGQEHVRSVRVACCDAATSGWRIDSEEPETRPKAGEAEFISAETAPLEGGARGGNLLFPPRFTRV